MPRTPRVEDGDGDELRGLVGCDDHSWATSKSEKKAPLKVNNMKKQTSTSHTPISSPIESFTLSQPQSILYLRSKLAWGIEKSEQGTFRVMI